METNLEEARYHAKQAIIRARSAFIGTHDEAPDYLQDNEYLTRGYRINHNSCCVTVKSLFTCHNESVNIWSHLIGALCFFGFFISVCSLVDPKRFVYGKQLGKEFSN